MEDTCCFCYRISYNVINDIIKRYECENVLEVQDYCKAGKACGACKKDIERRCEKDGKNTNSR